MPLDLFAIISACIFLTEATLHIFNRNLFFFSSDYLAVFAVPWALLFILNAVFIIDTRKQKLREYC